VSIEHNRKVYLKELRSGKYKKGTILSDEKGNPVFLKEEDKDGSCACAIMHDLFFNYEGTQDHKNFLKALGLTRKQCRYIQQNLNDSDLNFSEIADIIEKQIFNNARNKR
jgi:hypothetical protein